MKTIRMLLCLILLTGSALCSGQMLEDWNQGSPMSKPCTWWHWMDGNITRDGITKDLEAMAEAGYHEAQIFNIGSELPDGTVKCYSPEWFELVKWAAVEAKRLGMELCFHNGPGWSCSGGFWVKPEQSMQRVVWTETTLHGDWNMQNVMLPQPKSEAGYYEDIAVYALPSPKTGHRIKDYVIKSLGSNSSPNLQMPDPEETDAGDVCPKDKLMDITDRMQADGTLSWQVPAGEWIILRMGHTSTGKCCHPASNLTGGGLEVDKMSREALDGYWQDGIQPLLDYLGPLVGTSLTNCLVDSYEAGCGNWTPRFRQEFRRLRGYDPRPYLPTMAGYFIDGSEESERFLYDLRQTVNDLMRENYYNRFSELCHLHGLKLSVEPYAGPFNDLEVGESSDIVMGEFWTGRPEMHTSTKVASSIAHLNGRNVVGAESFTSGEETARWNISPAAIKSLGDMAWTEGINHYIYHTYAHQPSDDGPGYTLGIYGGHFNRLNTLWKAAIPYQQYVTRSQYLLQQGRFVGDVLVWAGEVSPNDGCWRNDIKRLGYDYDQIWTSQMEQLTVRDGHLVTRAGGEYRLLVLPECGWMTPRVLLCLKRLALQGAAIVGKRPEKSPSLQDYPQCDLQVKSLVQELWGDGLIRDVDVKQAMEALDVEPDFDAGINGHDLCFIHRTSPQGEIYFVSNPVKMYRTESCLFRVSGLVPERWDAQTGRITELPYMEEDGRTRVDLAFEPDQSAFVVFRPRKDGFRISDVQVNYNEKRQPLKNLKVEKAEYGAFLPGGVWDVTEKVLNLVKDGRLDTVIDNDAMGGDPSFGAVKRLVIWYEHDGHLKHEVVPEGSPVSISIEPSRIQSAFYGNIPPEFNTPRLQPAMDVTDKLCDMLGSGQYIITADDNLAGQPMQGEGKLLRITYSCGDRQYSRDIREGQRIDFTDPDQDGRLAVEDGSPVWITPSVSDVQVQTPDGRLLSAAVTKVPPTIAVNGPWKVRFQPGLQAPDSILADTLTSYTTYSEPGIRYYSGTAVYTGSVKVDKSWLNGVSCVRLSLGEVGVIAQVKINGRPVGTAWKEPYSLDVTGCLRPGENTLEISVANPWMNRLIGDQQPGAVPVGKATCIHWNADSPLEPAGLMGPVRLEGFVKQVLREVPGR